MKQSIRELIFDARIHGNITMRPQTNIHREKSQRIDGAGEVHGVALSAAALSPDNQRREAGAALGALLVALVEAVGRSASAIFDQMMMSCVSQSVASRGARGSRARPMRRE